MVTITKEELDKLKKIDHGWYGTIYKKDDNTAYKIYRDEVKNMKKEPIPNPNLTTIRLHYNLLLQRAEQIKQSGLIKDLIYINGRFKGVVIPFYNGIQLKKAKLSFSRRFVIAKKLITKSQELNNNLIYPTDYKPENIILQNGEPYFIDLDDVRTHAFIYPSPLFRKYSIRSLGYTIQEILSQYEHYYNEKIYRHLTRQKSFFPYTYHRIERYIQEKEQPRIMIFINKDTDLNRLKDNSSTYQYDIVYIFEKDDELKTLLTKLKEYQIPLYDIVPLSKLEQYPDIELIQDSYYYDEEYKLILKR